MDNNTFHSKIGIPLGHYCYEVISPVQYKEANGMPYHKIKWCPFWYGRRPNGGCLIYGWDPALGDAVKTCGMNEYKITLHCSAV